MHIESEARAAQDGGFSVPHPICLASPLPPITPPLLYKEPTVTTAHGKQRRVRAEMARPDGAAGDGLETIADGPGLDVPQCHCAIVRAGAEHCAAPIKLDGDDRRSVAPQNAQRLILALWAGRTPLGHPLLPFGRGSKVFKLALARALLGFAKIDLAVWCRGQRRV